MNGYIDLHLHTTFSDGALTPTQLVHHALRAHLRAIAITDHDTVDGNAEALAEGRTRGLEVIPGVELSIAYPQGELHILGYYIDHLDPELHVALRHLREHRRRRNPEIIRKLDGLGIRLDLEVIRKKANNGNVGRPHIAAAMVASGYVRSVKEAFNLYLRKDGPAYVPKEMLTPSEGIQLVRRVGGVPVLAHPHTLEITQPAALADFIAELKAAGLGGIEAYYLSDGRCPSELYRDLARQLDLCLTGGSDFHGPDKPEVAIGTGRGRTRLPYHLVEDLRSRRLPPSADRPHEFGDRPGA
jgi:hypothetical protein